MAVKQSRAKLLILEFIRLLIKYAINYFGNNDKCLRNIIYYPEIKDIGILADIINRISWYIPHNSASNLRVDIPISKDLETVKLKSSISPSSQGYYIKTTSNISYSNMDHINLDHYDAIMIWDKRALMHLNIIKNYYKVHIVDPTFYSYTESHTNYTMYSRTLSHDQTERMSKQSLSNYERLLKDNKNYNTSYIFGTGPSIDHAMSHDYEDGFRIICNSIIKNQGLLSHIRPHLLVFADPVFHLGPSKYADEFRKHMINVVRDYGCYVMTTPSSANLLIAHYPELRDRLIGMPETCNSYNFPLSDKFCIKNTGNIMTKYMLPIASAIADNIYIIGADGRKKGEKYFWKHNSTVQFDDLMESVYKTHPSFFRDRIYADYYNKHCRILREVIEYGERHKKMYYSLGNSYIPALSERMVREGKI